MINKSSTTTIIVSVVLSIITSVIVTIFMGSIYYFVFSKPSEVVCTVADGDNVFTPREVNTVSKRETDDRVSYACSGEAQICEENYRQSCIYIGCKCDDGFSPVGHVDGCAHESIEVSDYVIADESHDLTDDGYQYAFEGECAQICVQVGH